MELVQNNYEAIKYNDDNIFAKILKGEISCDKVYEDEHVLAFNDINPKAKIHVLVIPRSRFISFDDFTQKAGSKGVGIFFHRVGLVANKLGLSEGGYRVLMNHGDNANQEVPHFHAHILGGEKLGGI